MIRLLAPMPAEMQQRYRDAIIKKKYIKVGDWREALAEARQARAAGPDVSEGTSSQESPPGDALDITDEPDAVRQITAAIDDGALPGVYLRGRQLVHVSATDEYVVTRDLDEALMRNLIAFYLPCVKEMPKYGVRKALPEAKTCKAILAGLDWPKTRRLAGVASYPLLLPDGSLLQDPGYDSGSGIYLHEGVSIEPVPESPGKRETDDALAFLLGKFLKDFPWASDSDKANYLGILLAPLLREVIGDLFPLVYVTAPERGTGKSLLTELITILYGGAIRTFPDNDGEMRKVITASLRGAEPVIVFDNVECVVKSPSLAAALTARMWTDRILGGSADGKWPNDRLWMVTGVNVTLGGDLAQRSVRVAIDYGRPDPDQRARFAIPEIARWTQAHRGTVIRALLVLARSWWSAGAPQADHVMRGFTTWARIIGGILAHHGVQGFLANREEIRVFDEDYSEWSAFLGMLHSRYGSRSFLVRDILNDAAADRALADVMPSTTEGGAWTAKTLGKALAHHAGSWYDGMSIRSVEDKHAGSRRWSVATAPS